MKSLPSHYTRISLFALALVLVVLSSACKRGALAKHEYMYVSAQETSLRDRVATMYNKIGTVHSGDRVEVLEKQRRFLRVRTDSGQEGWIEERSLVPQDIYDAFQKLASDNASQEVQAHGTARSELNMHVTPSREGEHLYQLKDGEKVDILKRATAEKNPPKAAAVSATPTPKSSATTQPQSKTAPVPVKPPTSAKGAPPGPSSKPPEPPKPVMEDWYLVRNSAGHVGWVLLRMIDLDIPLDVAQYAEGQRIMGYFVLNTVHEEDKDTKEVKQVPQYLVLLNEPKDGLPWDFNQIRIFTRNRAKHRYETAYRERNLEGYFPVKTSHQDFGKEGDLPTFTIRKKNDDGQMVDVTYKLNGPIVRRVLTPEEEAAEKAKHDAALAAYYTQRKKQGLPAHPHHKHK
ncbi:MAG: SH3 domain-containing protein [Candidatus Korobacteraceae bacterium]